MNSTDCLQLADRLFPQITKIPEDYEAAYPPRALPEGARVTRIAPSPTGYLHIGTLYMAMINRLIADNTGGVFFTRIEDTDNKREVTGAVADIIGGLSDFGIPTDEGVFPDGSQKGDYGPYQQRQRAEIYQCYAKWLVGQGLAYPCFCTETELAALRERQEAEKVRTGYHGAYALCRDLTLTEIASRLDAGLPYVIRLRSPGDESRRISFEDGVKGKLELPENDEDFVLLKSDGIPTYHFAHAVDDHLMRVTHVIRGDEWLASAPKHLQLFRLLGFKPPKYAHIAPILKEENGNKRKISKRKDPEAAMTFFREQGFPGESVMEYLMTIAASDYEDWRRANPEADRSSFKLQLKKMSASGALFDWDKLLDVSKNRISRMPADAVVAGLTAWGEEFRPDFAALLQRDPAYAKAIFSIDRDVPKPRKDLAKWSDAPDFAAYFFPETYAPDDTLPEGISPETAAKVLAAYLPVYDPAHDKDAWFGTIKSICPGIGFASEMKEYKANPSAYAGNPGTASTVIRIAVTGRQNTPDLCAIMRLLGKETVMARLTAALESYQAAGRARRDTF